MGRHAIFNPLPPEEIIKRIKKALKHGGETHTWEDLREGLITGRYQIFWNDDGAVITEVVDCPQLRYLNLFIVAGQMPGVMDLEQQAEDFGRTQSCKYMTGSGRLGWEKVLKNTGWKKARTVFTKEIRGY